MYESLALPPAAAFAGACIYITFAEQPARLKLEANATLAQWARAYEKGFAMQASLAIVAGIFAILEWWQTSQMIWLFGAAINLANWPYTLIVILPINRQLKADIGRENSTTLDLLRRWGALHAWHSALGIAATSIFVAAAAHNR